MMPSHKWHQGFTKFLLGDSHREVHRLLDWPWIFLGRRHRILFHGLSAPFLGALAALLQGKHPGSGAAAGLGHIGLDHFVSTLRKWSRWLRKL